MVLLEVVFLEVVLLEVLLGRVSKKDVGGRGGGGRGGVGSDLLVLSTRFAPSIAFWRRWDQIVLNL